MNTVEFEKGYLEALKDVQTICNSAEKANDIYFRKSAPETYNARTKQLIEIVNDMLVLIHASDNRFELLMDDMDKEKNPQVILDGRD